MSAEHEVTELRVAITEACNLLRKAQCPNPLCFGGRVTWGMERGKMKQCEWCSTRKKLLDEHG